MELTAEETTAIQNAETRVEKKEVVKRIALRHQCGKATVHRALRRARTPALRKRADAAGAAARTGIGEDVLKSINDLILNSRGNKDRYEITMANAIRLAEQAGLIKSGSLSETTFARWLQERGRSVKHLERRAKRPAHVNVISERPNQLWQFDASAGRQQLLYPDGHWEAEENSVIYKNKPEKVRRAYDGKICRFQRYLAVDHATGLLMCDYDLAPGEAQFPAACFLALQFQDRGLPEKILSDKGMFGSEEKPTLLRRFLEQLGIEVITHTPGRPQAKGMVESAHWHWEQFFESRLFLRASMSHEEMRARAMAILRLQNEEEIHSRHHQTRAEAWETLPAERRRAAPPLDVCLDYLSPMSEERTVNEDLSVEYRGQSWRIGDPDLRGRKVEVRPALLDRESVEVIWNQQPAVIHKAKIIGRTAWGFPADGATLAHPRTPLVDCIIKEAEARRLRRGESAAAAFAIVPELPARIVRFPVPLTGSAGVSPASRGGQDARPPILALPPVRMITAMAGRLQAADELSPLSAGEKAALDLLLEGKSEIEERRIAEWIAAVNAARLAEAEEQKRPAAAG